MCKRRLENHVYVTLILPLREARLALGTPSRSGRQPLHSFLHKPMYPLVDRACRVTEVGGIGQRFQPKEHQVLVLG